MSPMSSVVLADSSQAALLLAVIHQAFADRPVLDPPGTALDETLESVAAALDEHGGLLATDDAGHPVGGLLFERRGPLLGLRRVGVLASQRGTGVAAALAERAVDEAAERGCVGLELEARAELPATVAFWERHGYVIAGRSGTSLTMLQLLPITLTLPEPEDTRSLGRQLAGCLQAGDLLVLTGDLGAGKTTFTQGLGAGLGVRGDITSPTFVIARVHPSLVDGPALVHVDAYRLGGAAELDDLDLDTDLDEAVTVVEWGEGLAEALSQDRLEMTLHRADDDVRTMTITPVGGRWREIGAHLVAARALA